MRERAGVSVRTSRGAQRLIAFQHAADLWGAILRSDITIRVQATFDPLACSASSATLGQAGPDGLHRDFAGAPVASTWYPVALANSLAGTLSIDTIAEGIETEAQRDALIGLGCANGQGYLFGRPAARDA